jgi:hypothetical protein
LEENSAFKISFALLVLYPHFFGSSKLSVWDVSRLQDRCLFYIEIVFVVHSRHLGGRRRAAVVLYPHFFFFEVLCAGCWQVAAGSLLLLH